MSRLSNDLERSYQGTFLGMYLGDKIKPVQVRGVEAGSIPRMHLYTASGEEYIKQYTDTDIVYTYPDLGYCKVQGEVYWLTRLPARQWHKGVKTSLVVAKALGGRSFKLSGVGSEFTYYALDFIYNNKYNASVQKYTVIHDGVFYYKGLKIAPVDEVLSLPDKFNHIKREFEMHRSVV